MNNLDVFFFFVLDFHNFNMSLLIVQLFVFRLLLLLLELEIVDELGGLSLPSSWVKSLMSSLKEAGDKDISIVKASVN